jgi:polar amino acid transport system ATP-binding protein
VVVSSPTRNDDILELRNIHKSYDGLAVLRGVSLSAKPGTVTSIIGSLGSGKSTWLCCANLLETCQAGDIVFAGEPLRWHGESEKRRPADNAQVRALCLAWPAHMNEAILLLHSTTLMFFFRISGMAARR